jgi:hypothetical protein
MYAFNLPRRLTPWLALLFVGSAGSVAWAMPDVVQPSSWKPGDGWHVRMIATPRGEAASRYDMHVVVTGAEKLGDVPYWRLEFIPVAAPQALGAGYRVWFDKTNGAPRRMSWRKKSKTAEPKLILEENLPLSLSPPLGFPLEVVPFVVTPLLRAKDGRTELRLSAQRELGYT